MACAIFFLSLFLLLFLGLMLNCLKKKRVLHLIEGRGGPEPLDPPPLHGSYSTGLQKGHPPLGLEVFKLCCRKQDLENYTVHVFM